MNYQIVILNEGSSKFASTELLIFFIFLLFLLCLLSFVPFLHFGTIVGLIVVVPFPGPSAIVVAHIVSAVFCCWRSGWEMVGNGCLSDC